MQRLLVVMMEVGMMVIVRGDDVIFVRRGMKVEDDETYVDQNLVLLGLIFDHQGMKGSSLE